LGGHVVGCKFINSTLNEMLINLLVSPSPKKQNKKITPAPKISLGICGNVIGNMVETPKSKKIKSHIHPSPLRNKPM
jgi:hypothetical protein